MSVRFPTRTLPQKLLAAALLAALSASATQAQTAVTWTQGATGNWKTTGNWTGLLGGDVMPNNGANTYTVTIPGVAGQANTTTVSIDNTTIAGNILTISGLTLSSALNQFGGNSAELVIGAGTTLNAGNLTNFSGTTLSGGRYFIDGTFKFTGANVQTLGANTTVVMNSAAAQMLNQANNANAFASFINNAGTFDIRNGYNHSALNNFVNSGVISVSEGSTFTTGTTFTNTGTLLASGVAGTGTFTLTGSTINNAGGNLNAGDKGLFAINGSQINGGTLTSSGSGRFAFTNNGGNALNGVTLAGNADLATSQGSARIINGMTFGSGGVININNNSVVQTLGDNALSGTGSIVFGNTGGSNRLAIDNSNSVLTIGSGVTVRGENGTIGAQFQVASGGTSILNNGKISADVSGGTLTIQQATVTNNNLLEAKNGGTLQLQSNVTNGVNGVLDVNNSGVMAMQGVTISGGTLTSSTGGRFFANNSAANTLDNVKVNGTIDLATTQGQLRIVNGIAMGGGNINVNVNSALVFTGNTTVTGNGTITLGSTGGSNTVALDNSNSVLTLGSGVLIHGENGTIGAQRNAASAATSILNNGTISADVNGGNIAITQATVSNNNILEAKNGGTLSLFSAVTNSAAGKVNANNNGVVVLNGTSISGGTINTATGGRFTATNNGNNFLNDVTVNGAVDLTSAQASIRVNGSTTGLTLTSGSTFNINNNSVLAFNGNQTLGGSGSVVLGNTGASNRVAIDQSGAVLTIGANATIRGHSGTIGDQYVVATAGASILNNGRISADVAGGNINITNATVTNNGILEAKNGGVLTLSSNVTGNVGSQISAGAGSVVLQNGVKLSGVVNSTGTGSLRATNNGNNFLDAVALTGTLDLATAHGTERVVNGFALNGTVNINNNSVLAFTGTQSLTGTGTIVLGGTGPSNYVALDNSNAVLTIGSGVKIRGENGTVGIQNFVASAATSIINNGRISADVAGGTINMTQATITNNGIMEALNGGTLVLSSNIAGTSNGQFIAGAGSTIRQNGVSVSGIINSGGNGLFVATNNGNNYLNGAT
ncbi:MAG: S-layer family protein, partial [Gemmatimonadaceae bacterium]